MFFKAALVVLTFLSFAAGQTCPSNQSYTASATQYLLNLNLSASNITDGPRSISEASTTTTVALWTIPDMKYYNYFAAASYCPYTVTNSTLSCCYCSNFNSTVTNHTVFENSTLGTLALITLHPSKTEIVVTFRGSVALMNWIQDANLIPDPQDGNVQIHTGVLNCLMSLYYPVVGYVGKLLTAKPTYRVVITGHSLGGSMASLFTYFLISRQQFPAGTTYALVTFGQTRVGNQGYADYMNALTIQMARVVARADIVPHLTPVNPSGDASVPPLPIDPSLPSIPGIYYLHHMQEVWINGTTTTYCSRTHYEDFNCSNSMGPSYSLVDHLQYFDADYTSCYFVEGLLDVNLLTIPGVGSPTSYIPPMPKFLQNLFVPLASSLYSAILPLLG